MRRKTRRRWFPVVDRSLQFGFLVVILCYGALLILVLSSALFLPDFIRLTDQTQDFQARMTASQIILAIHQRLWLPVFVFLALMGIHFFRLFHRLVGPLYRFRLAFGQIAKGDLSLKVRIRKKDFLHQEEAAINDMIQGLSEKMALIRDAATAGIRSLDRLETGIFGVHEAEIRGSLKRHRQVLETLMEKLADFHLAEKPYKNTNH